MRGRVKQLRALVRPGAVERELDEELAHHVELETEQNIHAGMPPAAARRAALLAFNGVERYKERVREERWTTALAEVGRDVRYAARALARQPTFTLTAVLTLALGIGVNTALFGVINALVFRPPAGVASTDGLVRVQGGGMMRSFSHPDFRQLAAAAGPVLSLAAQQNITVSLSHRDDPARVGAEMVSGNYFDVLGLSPVRGRFFVPSEDAVPVRDAVAVISHSLWQGRFGGAEDVVGSTVVVNGRRFEVIGVAPHGFQGFDLEERADIWVPLMTQPWAMPRGYEYLENHGTPQLGLVGRLAPGATVAQAGSLLAAAAGALPAAERFEPVQPVVRSLRGWLTRRDIESAAPALVFAWLLTLLVLIICCANVLNLQISRAIQRRREMAVRLALGAGQGRLVRLQVTEAVLLAVAGAAAGVLLATALGTWVRVRFLGPLAALDLGHDVRTIVFTLALAAVAGLGFGMLPALRLARAGLMLSMKGDDDRFLNGGRMRGALVAIQVAISLVLLMTAGLFVTRLDAVRGTDLGFDASRVAAFSVDLHALGYSDGERAAFFDELRAGLQRIPGVEAVAGPTYVPLGSGAALMAVALPGELTPNEASPLDTPQTEITRAEAMAAMRSSIRAVTLGVAPEFFEVLQVDPLRGRLLDAGDQGIEPGVAVISSALARRLWDDGEPIGRSVVVGGQELQVVGVVAELPAGHMAEPSPLQVYRPAAAHLQFAEQQVMVRLRGDAATVLPLLRAEVRRIDPDLPIEPLRLLSSDVAQQIGTQRMLTRLIGGFGTLALLLAGIGLYGIVASAVAARRREIGIRIALGARARDVTRLFVYRGMRVTITGLLIGSGLALAVGRLVSTVVWGVDPLDLRTLALAAVLLAATALLASWAPSRRAAMLDPTETLRPD